VRHDDESLVTPELAGVVAHRLGHPGGHRGLGLRAGELGSDETLVVVSHGAAISLAVTALLGLDPAGWRGIAGMHNVHWSHLHRSGPGAVPEWRLVAHNVGAGYPLDQWQAGPDWNLEPGPKSA
jgi:probable phosphoglycerate mutase